MLKLFDTHTHFDVSEFDEDRLLLAQKAKQRGVEKIILIGLSQARMADLLTTHQQLQNWQKSHSIFQSYLAPGLHPIYIEQHQDQHLDDLATLIQQNACVAIGEIGLDRFLKEHQSPLIQQRQQFIFQQQIELAKQFNLPVLLHIRKAHSDVLKLLKHHQFKQGGIAHAFSGGIEEAKAFIKLGFKIGITGQITNPNAKRIRQIVTLIGAEHLVIETDCPDMLPFCCRLDGFQQRNEPAYLIYVLQELAIILNQSIEQLAKRIWLNSHQCLALT